MEVFNKDGAKFQIGVIESKDKFKSMFTHNQLQYGHQGQFFLDMVRSSAMISKADGESSDGRALHRVLTPEEAIARAQHLTELAFQMMEVRGWSGFGPHIEDLVENTQQQAGFGVDELRRRSGQAQD